MISPKSVHDVLARHQLADGMKIVLDLERSHGSWLFDAVSEREYLDAFTCFASWPVGYNHPLMASEKFQSTLLRAALANPSNSDLYTQEMAGFVDAFASRVTPDSHPYHFWVSGGALAVENALKTAFDWKARKLGRTDFHDNVNDLVILHFEGAFHGRSGYTMSLTNTIPDKVGLFPKFDWPRVPAPAVEFDLDGNIANDIETEEDRARHAIESAFAQHKGKVAGIIIEPMQGEGGDRHFRTEFLQSLREYADAEEALLIYDEVQTGFFGSGRPWLWQVYGVEPDVVAFGKKTQVCGIYANRRLDEVEDHVFVRSSRINSTWGGNLTDMVRCHRFIEIIEQDGLAESITQNGARALNGLRAIARETGAITNVRGVGSLIAFTLPDPATRDRMIATLYQKQLLALACGPTSVRFRLPLVIQQDEVDSLLERVTISVPAVMSQG